jgi:hypothetical protein
VLPITTVVAVHFLVQSEPGSVHFGFGFMANVQRAGVKLGSKSCDFRFDESDDLVGVGIDHFAETIAFGGGSGFGVIVGEIVLAVCAGFDGSRYERWWLMYSCRKAANSISTKRGMSSGKPAVAMKGFFGLVIERMRGNVDFSVEKASDLASEEVRGDFVSSVKTFLLEAQAWKLSRARLLFCRDWRPSRKSGRGRGDSV